MTISFNFLLGALPFSVPGSLGTPPVELPHAPTQSAKHVSHVHRALQATLRTAFLRGRAHEVMQ